MSEVENQELDLNGEMLARREKLNKSVSRVTHFQIHSVVMR